NVIEAANAGIESEDSIVIGRGAECNGVRAARQIDFVSKRRGPESMARIRHRRKSSPRISRWIVGFDCSLYCAPVFSAEDKQFVVEDTDGNPRPWRRQRGQSLPCVRGRIVNFERAVRVRRTAPASHVKLAIDHSAGTMIPPHT